MAAGKHKSVCLAFFSYFSLFGNFISLPSQWHRWWSLLFQLKCVLKPAGESVWQPHLSSCVLWMPPAPAWCSIPPGGDRSQVRRNQPYVVSTDGFVMMCPLSSALHGVKISVKVGVAQCIPIWLAGAPFEHLCTFHRHGAGAEEQVGYVQKDISASFKMLMVPQASWGCSVMRNKLLLYGFVSSCEFNTVFKEQEVYL